MGLKLVQIWQFRSFNRVLMATSFAAEEGWAGMANTRLLR